MTGDPFIVCVAVQASLAKKVSHDMPKCLIFVHTINPLLIMKLHHGGGGGGGTLIFSAYLGSGPASTFNPKNIRNFKHPRKIFEILESPKNMPYAVP